MPANNTSKKQYTVRNVPAHLDKSLRRIAAGRKQSLNRLLLQALESAGAQGGQPGTAHGDPGVLFDDLDFLIGSWREDPEFDQVAADQRQVDQDLWK